MFYTKSRIPIFNFDFTNFAIWRLFKISLTTKDARDCFQVEKTHTSLRA